MPEIPDNSYASSEKAQPPVLSEKPALDERWFHQFRVIQPVNILKGVEASGVQREAQKVMFETEHLHNPNFSYPNLDINLLHDSESKLLELKEQIKEKEKDIDIRNIYTWKINEELAKTRMMACTTRVEEINKLNNPTEQELKERQQLMRRFRKYSAFVYGLPSSEIAAYSASKYLPMANEAMESDNVEVQATATRTPFYID